MPVNVLMPALSPTMEEGTLLRWLVKEGQSVTTGTVLAEIETDKATMDFEAVDGGTIGKIIVPEGTEGVKVNELIAVLLEEGEDARVLEAQALAEPPTAISEQAGGHPPRGGLDKRNSAPTPSDAIAEERIFASPLARRIAAEQGIDLHLLSGTGPGGRIIKADVLEAGTRLIAAGQRSQDTPTGGAVLASEVLGAEAIRQIYADRSFEEIALDGMRKSIAARLAEAKQTIPHFYLRREIRMDPLIAFRSELNRQLAAREVKLTVNDFIVKASARALQEVPECNAVWAGDRIIKFAASDIAVAVAIEGGLFTPVLRDADAKSLSTLSSEMKVLAERARKRKLAPHEYQGGSISISNLGMMGIDSFDAVINPPQAAILAVGASVQKPAVNEAGEIRAATFMSVTLSVDHRVIDGAMGADFLEALKQGLENPMALLV